MSNKNENNFYIISCPGGLLKLDIMLRKANVLTCFGVFLKIGKIPENCFMMRRLHFGSRYVK